MKRSSLVGRRWPLSVTPCARSMESPTLSDGGVGSRSLFVDHLNAREGVRLVRGLVRPVALHAGETERQSARVPRADLNVIEGNFNDQLGANVDRAGVAADLEREELLGLPGQHLVRQPLERFAEHDEATTLG